MVLNLLQGMGGWWSRIPGGGRVLLAIVGAGSLYGLLCFQFGPVRSLWLLAIIVVAVLILLLIKMLAKRQEKKKSEAAREKLLTGMSASGAGGLDESQEERDTRKRLEERWESVYRTLKERNYDYYSFPWYLIIGPAQSGKTTSIQKSDLEFPIGDKPVTDYGGTRGCNWFFTNRAILVDTAGRYVEHLGQSAESWNSMLARDQDEWNTFLDLLRTMRSRAPINGVILTIKVADIVAPDPESRQHLVDTLRRALLDIEERLKVRVPVYILITMCDKLVGFIDFFKNLPGLADRTLFGWSRPGAYDEAFDADQMAGALGGVKERLDRLLIEFMEQDASRGAGSREDLVRMDRLSSFPDEFATLIPHLKEILERIFAPSAYNEHHFFRGVYFTSGLQEGRPVLSACRALVGADHVDSLEREDVGTWAGDSKAFFIADLYQEKIFQEAGLVRLTQRASREQRRKKYAYMTVSAVIALVATLWIILSATSLYELSAKPRGALHDAMKAEGLHDIDADQAPVLESMGELSEGMATLRNDAPTLTGSKVESVDERVGLAYAEIYAEKIFGPLVGLLLDDLESYRPANADEAGEINDLLVGLRDLGRAHQARRYGIKDFRAVLDNMEQSHAQILGKQELRVYARARDLARVFGEEGDDTPEPVKKAAAGLDERIDETLQATVLGYWERYLGLLSDPPETVNARGSITLQFARYWGDLLVRRDSVDIEVNRLRTAVRDLRNVSNLAQFKAIAEVWKETYPKLEAARTDLLARFHPDSEPARKKPHEFLGAELDKFERQAESRKRIEEGGDRTERDLKAKTEEVRALFPDLTDPRVKDKWDRLDEESRLWRRGKSLERVALLRDLILYSGEPHKTYLDPSEQNFGKLSEPKGLENIVGLLTGDLGKLEDKQESEPASVQALLKDLDNMGRARIKARVATVVLVEIRTRAKTPELWSAFLAKLQASTTRSSKDEVEGRLYTAGCIGKLLGMATAVLADSIRLENDPGVWSEATGTREAIAENVEGYLADFIAYWQGGLCDAYFKDPDTALKALTRALEGGDPGTPLRTQYQDWYKGQPDLASNLRILAEFAGTQAEGKTGIQLADSTWTSAFNNRRTLARKEDIERIEKFWQHYSNGKMVDELEQYATAIDAGLASLNRSASDDGTFVDAGSAFLKSGDLEKPAERLPKLPSIGETDGNHPLYGLLIRHAETIASGLEQLPQQIFGGGWRRLVDSDAASAVIDKFPFDRAGATGRGSPKGIATWEELEAFLNHKALLELVRISKGRDGLNEQAQTFLARCVALRKLMGFDLPPGERTDHAWSIRFLKGQTGKEDPKWTDWRIVLEQPGSPGNPRTDILIAFLNPLQSEFKWKPGIKGIFLVESREGSETGPWVPDFPLGIDPRKETWANALVMLMGGEGRTLKDGKGREIRLLFRGPGNTVGDLVFEISTEPPLPDALPDVRDAKAIRLGPSK